MIRYNDLELLLPADIQAVGVDDQQAPRDDPRLAMNDHRFVFFQREPSARITVQNLALLVLELYNRQHG